MVSYFLKSSRRRERSSKANRRGESGEEDTQANWEHSPGRQCLCVPSEGCERSGGQVQTGGKLQSAAHDRNCFALQELECNCGRGRTETAEEVQATHAQSYQMGRDQFQKERR